MKTLFKNLKKRIKVFFNLCKMHYNVTESILDNTIVFIHIKTVNGYLIYATADKYAYLVKLIPTKGDEEYARICAEELCEMLNDDPHKLRKHDK